MGRLPTHKGNLSTPAWGRPDLPDHLPDPEPEPDTLLGVYVPDEEYDDFDLDDDEDDLL